MSIVDVHKRARLSWIVENQLVQVRTYIDQEVVGAIAGRRNGTTAHGIYRMPFFPLAPVFTLLALLYVVYANWQDPEEGRPGMIATAAQIVLAAGYYWLILKRRGAWVVRDPTTI